MTDLPSIEYPDWEANQPDGYTRSLNQILAAQEHQELETRNQEFRAICDRRDFQVTHIWARPDEDPVTTAPEEDVESVWPGENDDFGVWFTYYDHLSDFSIDQESSEVTNDTEATLADHPERENELSWYLIPADAPREDKIRRLVAHNYPYDLDPYPIGDAAS